VAENDNNILKGKETKILVFLALFVFMVHVWHVTEIGIFSVLDDEFGYWGIAAYFAGLDWSDAISEIPYYSYGYSLLLIPLFWIFDNPVYMYKAGIILNGILISSSFLLCYDMAKKLLKNVNMYILMGISFAIAMYPAYLAYSSIAWPECLLIFIFWLLTWCFLDLGQESANYKFFLIGFLSIYMYTVHQRALGILIASILVVLIMKILKNINYKQLLLTFLPIVILLCIHVYIKEIVQSNLWLVSNGSLTNDYSAQVGKLIQLMSIDGLIRALRAFAGQFFYIGAASFLIAYFGLVELAKIIGKAIRTATKNRQLESLFEEPYFNLYAFLCIAFLLSIAINIVFMINPTRLDHLFYGRYIEMLIGPLILLGLVFFIRNGINSSLAFWFVLGGFAVLSFVAHFIIQSSGLDTFHSMQASGLQFIILGVLFPSLLAIMICRLLYLSIAKNNGLKTLFSLSIVSLCFFLSGQLIVGSITDGNQDSMEIMEVAEYLKTLDNKTPVYFLWDAQGNPDYGKWDNRNTSKRLVADRYQFLLLDKPLILVDRSELDAIPGDKYVLLNEKRYLSELNRDYELRMSNRYSYLLSSK